MSRQINHRSSSSFAAADVAAVMLDEEYLRARLDKLGGPGARLLEHSVEGTSGRYRIRHGVHQAALPSIVSSLVSGNLVIERAESLHPDGAGRYVGDVDVRIPGTPASAVGSLRLADTAAGSELLIHADVTVKVPVVGGRIEAVIADQVQQLLAAETAFTLEWMAHRQA